jgi:hypothetical protein
MIFDHVKHSWIKEITSVSVYTRREDKSRISTKEMRCTMVVQASKQVAETSVHEKCSQMNYHLVAFVYFCPYLLCCCLHAKGEFQNWTQESTESPITADIAACPVKKRTGRSEHAECRAEYRIASTLVFACSCMCITT